MNKECKRLVLVIFCLAVITVVSSSHGKKKRFQKDSFLGIQQKKLHPATCFFDDIDIPCQWSNQISDSLKNKSFSLKGNTDGYRWFVYSYWFQKSGINLDPFRFFKIYRGNLLLVVYVNFKRLPDTTVSVLKQNSTYMNFKDGNSESSSDEDKIDISSQLSVSEFEYKSRVVRSENAVSHYPIKIPFREYRSPVLEIEKEGCVSFRLRGNSHLSNSDFLNLWATDETTRSTRLLWSSYGPIPKIWRHYAIGLYAGKYFLSFNGSMFFRSRMTRLLFAYEMDDIEVSTSPCCEACAENKIMSIATGFVLFTLSEYTEKTCQWIAFSFKSMPTVNVSVVIPNVSAVASVTHASKTGINVCIDRKSGDGNKLARIDWVAKPMADAKLESQKIPKTNEKNKVSTEESDKVYRLPTLPNEKNYDSKLLGKNLFDRLFSSRICNSNEFECDWECIPLYKRCDGIRDCLQGEDEMECPDRFGFLLFSALSVAFVLSMFMMVAHYACLDKSKQKGSGDKTNLLHSGNLSVSDFSYRPNENRRGFERSKTPQTEIRGIATVD